MSEFGASGWLSQLSVRLLVLAQVMVSRFVGSSPSSGSALTVLGSLPLSPSLPALPLLVLAHAHALSQNKYISILKIYIKQVTFRICKLYLSKAVKGFEQGRRERFKAGGFCTL